MRVMVLIKADEDTEAGILPDDETLFVEMGKFNEALVDAGVMLAGDGLQPTSKGVRVHFSGGDREVVDGPFAETKELVAGYWLWKVESMQEAIDWVKRCPNPTGVESTIEIRPLYEYDDLGPTFSEELREAEERLRERIADAT